MDNDKKLSNVTNSYLMRYDEILDNMIKEMTHAQLSRSISHNFIVQMVPHHKAAIQMSKNILRYTICIPLQNIALNIIDEQTKGIEKMKKSLSRCNKFENHPREIMYYQKNFNHIARSMFSKMKNAPVVNSVDQDFIREMIPHHEGAIYMSENLLRFKICPELRPIANSIIVSQTNGIKEMRKILSNS